LTYYCHLQQGDGPEILKFKADSVKSEVNCSFSRETVNRLVTKVSHKLHLSLEGNNKVLVEKDV